MVLAPIDQSSIYPRPNGFVRQGEESPTTHFMHFTCFYALSKPSYLIVKNPDASNFVPMVENGVETSNYTPSILHVMSYPHKIVTKMLPLTLFTKTINIANKKLLIA